VNPMTIYQTHFPFVGIAGAFGATIVYPIDMGKSSNMFFGPDSADLLTVKVSPWS
jgi:hypothetical protein